MRPRRPFELPADLTEVKERAVRLERITIGFMLSIVAVMYLSMGSSQAMKVAWVEDVLSLVAPIAFLIASRREQRPPDSRFPYGHHEAFSIAFLAGAVALTLFGGYLLIDSVLALIRADRPTIGTRVVFGAQIWSGWLMVGALAYSAVPPLILGRMKLRLAERLHDKTLKADADMNRADWLTALGGIIGVLGVGLGFWWADAVAGAIISLDVVRDGLKNLSRVVRELMDERPTDIHGRPSDLPELVRQALLRLDWVEDVAVRFREEGRMLAGEAFLVPSDERDLVRRFEEALDCARAVHWRIHDVVFTLTSPEALHHAPPESAAPPSGPGSTSGD